MTAQIGQASAVLSFYYSYLEFFQVLMTAFIKTLDVALRVVISTVCIMTTQFIVD